MRHGSGHGDGIKARDGDGDGVVVNGVAAPSGKGPKSTLLGRNGSTRVWYKVYVSDVRTRGQLWM